MASAPSVLMAGLSGTSPSVFARVTYLDTGTDGSTVTVHTTVPQHADSDIPTGTLKAIEKDLEPAFGKGWLTK